MSTYNGNGLLSFEIINVNVKNTFIFYWLIIIAITSLWLINCLIDDIKVNSTDSNYPYYNQCCQIGREICPNLATLIKTVSQGLPRRISDPMYVTMWAAGITLGEGGVLTIERVKKEDEGLYECMASNVEGSIRTSAVVTVSGRWPIAKVMLNGRSAVHCKPRNNELYCILVSLHCVEIRVEKQT